MFNSKTVLIGHSLESDLKALKLIHDVVVDTSVLYPHKMGPPKKRALKTLCIENLKRIIQEDGKNNPKFNIFNKVNRWLTIINYFDKCQPRSNPKFQITCILLIYNCFILFFRLVFQRVVTTVPKTRKCASNWLSIIYGIESFKKTH